MKFYWSETNSKGLPLEPGTFCGVSDPEDGTHPIWTYGTSQNEVTTKIAMNNLHARATLDRRAAATPQNPAAPRVTVPARMTPGEVMEATAQLSDPARAGAAASRLIADETGFDPAKAALESFKRLAAEWEDETPEFYPHPANRTVMALTVKPKVQYRVGLITKEMLDETFADLSTRGQLVEAPQSVAQPVTPPSNLETFPGSGQVRSVERPRGARFATGIPARRLGSPQIVQPKTLKYTKQDIDTMPLEKERSLIRGNDPDYAAACEFYYGPQAMNA